MGSNDALFHPNKGRANCRSMMSKPTRDSGIVPSGFFVLRTPRLPFDCLPGDREAIRRLLERPEVREAIFVAAPALDERIHVWQRDPDCEEGRKIEQALTRYLVRMTARPTPFGLFAGCSVGTMGKSTRLEVNESYHRHTRLDMDYVVGLADSL